MSLQQPYIQHCLILVMNDVEEPAIRRLTTGLPFIWIIHFQDMIVMLKRNPSTWISMPTLNVLLIRDSIIRGRLP